MEYVNYIKAKTYTTFSSKTDKPVLSEEDEKFLTRITSDNGPRPFSPTSPTYPTHGGDAQLALLDGAQNIQLPPETLDEITDPSQDHPGDVSGSIPETKQETLDKNKNNNDADNKAQSTSRTTWSWLRRDSRDKRAADQTNMADSLHDIAVGLKAADAQPNEDGTVSSDEAKKEEEDMTIVLEKLNLAAVNNRVFSISDETQELLQKFNLVFRDLIKGVPTAYDDLEKLLTIGDKQLQGIYDTLPPFLKKLIEKMPETMTKGIAPGMMAAAAEGSAKTDSNLAKAGRAAGAASKFLKTPSLKELVAKPSGIAAMLRSIMTFLRARFPAFFGMNVLWSLAMFVLLIIFWYCYKRGREVRLEKERSLTESEILRLDVEWRSQHPNALITTAPEGASIEEVQAGAQDITKPASEQAATAMPNATAAASSN